MVEICYLSLCISPVLFGSDISFFSVKIISGAYLGQSYSCEVMLTTQELIRYDQTTVVIHVTGQEITEGNLSRILHKVFHCKKKDDLSAMIVDQLFSKFGCGFWQLAYTREELEEKRKDRFVVKPL